MAPDSYGVGVVLILACCALSVAGLLITRRVVDLRKLRDTHDVGGYLLSVVGTLYAVLLGLIVVDSMQKFQTAREVTEKEANALVNVYMLSSRLPEPKKTELKKLCVDYANQVVNVEWKDMDSCCYCPEARRLAVKLMQTLVDFEPTTENQKALFPQMISDVSEVWQCRRARINIATNGIPVPEWIALIAGGVITMFFTYFFGLENLRVQIVMTSMVAMLISLNVYLVLLFAYPFSGDLCINTESFKINQLIFENRVGSTPKAGSPDCL